MIFKKKYSTLVSNLDHQFVIEYEQTNAEPKVYDEYEDEDEYDSEMDDFIDGMCNILFTFRSSYQFNSISNDLNPVI